MDSAIRTVRDSPQSNRLNEIKGRSNIRYDSVVSTKLSHESLMLSFVELLTFDPVYGIVEKFLCPIGTTSALLITVGVLLNLLKSSSIELLMRGVILVRKAAKPSLYGT
jgi:hypothetical protein